MTTDQSQRRGPVELELDISQLGRRATRPVFEGVGREVGRRNDEPAFVWKPNNNVRKSDFFNLARNIALTDDDHIAHANRIRECQLDTGKNISQGLLGCKTGDHRNDTGRGQNGCHCLTRGIKSEEGCANTKKDDQSL